MAAHAPLPSAATVDAASRFISLSQLESQPYDRERLVGEVRSLLADSSASMLAAGARLIVLKAHEPHGEFLKVLGALGLEARGAQRMMKAARLFLTPELQRFGELGKTKLFELMALEEETLESLAVGVPIAGVNFEALKAMSVKALRAAVKRMREAEAASDRIDRATANASTSTHWPQLEEAEALKAYVLRHPQPGSDVASVADGTRRGRVVLENPDGTFRVLWAGQGEAAPQVTDHHPEELVLVANVSLTRHLAEGEGKGPVADGHGFSGTATDLRRVIDERLHEVASGIGRVRAVLRMLKYRVEGMADAPGRQAEDAFEEIVDVVTVALGNLPEVDGHLRDLVDEEIDALWQRAAREAAPTRPVHA